MKIIFETLGDFLEYVEFTEDSDPIKYMNIGDLKDKIKKWITDNNIISQNKYNILSNYSLNVYTNVILSKLRLTKLPEFIHFKYVFGGFQFDYNRFITLERFPRLISGNCVGSYNNLTNLIGGPEEIKGSFFISHNKLTSLEGFPLVVGDTISVSNNKLQNLKGLPSVINGSLYIHNNPIETLNFFPKEIEKDLYYTPSDTLKIEDIKNICNVKGNIYIKN